jgi:hypothetical protein
MRFFLGFLGGFSATELLALFDPCERKRVILSIKSA